MFRNTLARETQLVLAESGATLGKHSNMSRQSHPGHSTRHTGPTLLVAAAFAGLCAPAVLAQTYVPVAVPTASTTLYTSSAVVSPGRVGVDRAGNVFFVAVGSSSSTLMEIPAATQTGVNTAPVPLITGLGQYNAKAVVVDTLGNLWVTTGNQESAVPPGGGTDYISLAEIPTLNGVPNTALVTGGITLGKADAAHCTLGGTAVCTVLNYKMNDSASLVAGPQVLDFTMDASGNATYIDVYDNNLSAGAPGDFRIVKTNVYNGGGSVLATVPSDSNSQVALDGAGNTYYCSPASGKVSLVTSVAPATGTGTLTTVGVTPALGAAAVTAPTGISSDYFGNLFIAGGTQLSEVPFEATALNFVDEFGIITALTNTISDGGALDQYGNYYYAYNGTASTAVIQMQINGYNFGLVAIGTIVNPTSTPIAPTWNVYAEVASPSTIASYYPTGNQTINTTVQYLQSFPFSGSKSYAGGTSWAANTDYTFAVDFEPIHPGLLKGAYTPRSGGPDYLIINLAGVGVGPEPLFLPGTPSQVFNASATKALNLPQGLAIDSYGDIFVADTGNGKVVADCLATTTDTEDGSSATNGNTLCSALAAAANGITQLGTSFTSPAAIALDGAADLFVVDSGASTVTLLNGLTAVASTLVPATAKFGGTALSGPMGIATDAYNNVYVADTGNNRIVEAHQVGSIYSTQAATATPIGTNNIVYVPATALFGGTALKGPTGLAIDGAQDLFIADTGNNRIVEYSGSGGTSVISTGSITLSSPYAVAVYPSGQLVVTDKTNGVVLVNGASSKILSFGTAYTTTGAQGIALDPFGNIYVSNTTAGQVLELNVTSPQSIAFPATNDLAVSANISETVLNQGNAALVFSSIASSSANFTVTTAGTCTGTGTVAIGGSCTVISNFSPQSVGPLTASVVLTDNQLSYTLNTSPPSSGENEIATFATNGTQALSLTGTATSAGAPQTITFPAPASPITYTTTPITLTATASSNLPVAFSVLSGPGTIPTGSNQLTVTGVGTIVIAANQLGSVSFSAAPQITQSIVVTQATQTITFAPTSPITYSATAFNLTGTASSGLTVAYAVVSGPGTIPTGSNALTTTGLGTIVISATQAGNANYAAAPAVQASIVVNAIGTVATPKLSLIGGTYNAAWFNNLPASPVLTMSDATAGATIYYTTNGTTPTTSSTSYTGNTALNGIILTGTQTIQAIAVLPPGYANSAVASATYTISTAPENLAYTLSPTSLTLQPGASGTINITVTPQNGINATISFGCTGLPPSASCSFSPATVTTAPVQAPVSTVLTVTAPTNTSSNRRKRRPLQVGLLLATAAFCLTMFSGCGTTNSGEALTVTVAISGDAVRVTPTFVLNVQ